MRYLYTTCLKNWEFDKKASQNSDLERATIVRAQGASEDENFEKKPTQSKTNFSDTLCIYRKCLKNWNLARRLRKFFCLERATIVRAQGASEDENFEKKPTQSKTNFSDTLCIISFFFFWIPLSIFSQVYPIQFSIPEHKIVKEIPEKDRDFAHIIPGDPNTYIYTDEEDYYTDYQHSYFAVTMKKAGWDCMRHYEILANGCIPYFVDLDKCDKDTMFFLPRDLILEAMNLPGVSYLHIDHSQFDTAKYYEILNKLLEHTRKYLTTRNMAQYILDTVHYTGTGKILYLSNDEDPDYLRCITLVGFKELLGDRVVDVPKIQHIYKSYPGDIKRLYGKGFTYTKNVEDLPIDRENIEERIRNKEIGRASCR